jgi:hypothetical protein
MMKKPCRSWNTKLNDYEKNIDLYIDTAYIRTCFLM